MCRLKSAWNAALLQSVLQDAAVAQVMDVHLSSDCLYGIAGSTKIKDSSIEVPAVLMLVLNVNPKMMP